MKGWPQANMDSLTSYFKGFLPTCMWFKKDKDNYEQIGGQFDMKVLQECR